MKLFSRFAGQGLRGILPAVAVGAAALLYAAFQAWRVSSGAWENALVMVLFAAVAGWDAVKGPATAGPSRGARLTAWGLLGAGLVLAVLPWGVNSGLPGRCALLFAALAAALFGCGTRIGLRMAGMLFLCFLAIPYQEYWTLALSYPLRLISTCLSAETLRFFGDAVEYHLTTIRVGGAEIAITDACSGIRQLEALLLLGYLIVRRQHTRTGWAVLHYFFMLPAIIAANSVRIAATVLLFHWIGAAAFDDFRHTLLGYLLVIVALLLFWWFGALFPDTGKARKEESHE